MARTAATPAATKPSNVDALIAPHLAYILDEMHRERAALAHKLAVNVDALEADYRAARIDRERANEQFMTALSTRYRPDSIEASRVENEAHDRWQRAVDEKRTAERRDAELAGYVEAAETAAAKRDEYDALQQEFVEGGSRQRAIAAAVPGMRAKLDELQATKDAAERAEVDRIAGAADAQLAEILGETATPATDNASPPALYAIERALASQAALVRRAEEAVTTLAQREDELRGALRECAHVYRVARARSIELRWRAAMLALGSLPTEYVASHRLRATKPGFVVVDDIATARAMAAIDAELAPIPPTAATPSSDEILDDDQDQAGADPDQVAAA